MTGRDQGRLIRSAISPYGLALVSYAVFLLAWMIPPAVYSRYVEEPDLVFFDPATILFYSLCVLAFIAGAWLVEWVSPAAKTGFDIRTRISPLIFVMIPLALGVAATFVTMVGLIRKVPDILLMLVSQQGADLKGALAEDVDSNLMLAPLLLITFTWWALWRLPELELRGWKKRVAYAALTIAVLVVVIASAITLLRNLVMMIVCGLIVVYVWKKSLSRAISAMSLIKFGAGFAIGISALFMAFSMLRGAASWDGQIHTLMGYTIASYNRLAAIVNGQLRYPFAGRGAYISYVADYGHAINAVLPLGSMINPPSFLDLWASEFGAVSRAGLDGTLIWSGTFGYIFSDLGWFSPLLICCYGILNGAAWLMFKRGTVAGAVLYPYCAFCILTWFGTNSLLDSGSEAIVAAAIFLFIYEAVFTSRVKHGAHAGGGLPNLQQSQDAVG